MREQEVSHALQFWAPAILMQLRLSWHIMQAPVGNDDFSFGYRDLEGSKVHKGLREGYGAPFGEVSQLSDTCLPAGCTLQQCQRPLQPICRQCAAGEPCLTHDMCSQGDIIGCFIHMPEGGRRLEKSKAVSHPHSP